MQEKPARKLTDDEAYELVHEALLTLGSDEAETLHANGALKTARMALTGVQIALIMNVEGAKGEPQR